MAKEDNENPEVRQLREIRRELRNIESNTSAKWWILHGILYGAGWVLGSLLAILLIGWILSVMGIIPGLDKIAQDIGAAFTRVGR
ncbi:MAG TPA: hypothetical protein VG102_02655 [Candidatus Paceibacterota bacterium]|jgi:hypothetical protein|nr:hypothetical protein [Candidatus Paceibacterota bacterium]